MIRSLAQLFEYTCALFQTNDFVGRVRVRSDQRVVQLLLLGLKRHGLGLVKFGDSLADHAGLQPVIPMPIQSSISLPIETAMQTIGVISTLFD